MRVTSLYFRNWTDGTASKEIIDAAHGVDVDGVIGEYIVLEDTAVVQAPKSLSYEEAATLPTAGLTAWNATAGKNELRDRIVLVQGTGGVSIFALQFANAAKARVIVTSSSDDKLVRARELGARDGINYRTHPKWSEQVMKLTGGHGADLVVDVGGKESLEQSVKSLAYGGMLSIVGGLSGYDGTISSLGLLNKTASARGVYVGSRADYQRMSAFIDEHRLHPVIDKVFPLDQFDAALAAPARPAIRSGASCSSCGSLTAVAALAQALRGAARSFQLLGIELAVLVGVELVEQHRRRVDELVLADLAVAVGVDASAHRCCRALAALIGALARVGVVDDAVAIAIHSRELRGARVDVFLPRDLAVVIGIGAARSRRRRGPAPALRSWTAGERQRSQLS